MNELFKPAWWLRDGHLQTLWPTFIRRSFQDIILKRERIELADGDFIDLDWTGPADKPIILILHGLEGSIESPYAKGMMQALAHQGFRSVFMHFRGCSGEPNRLSRAYHSGETADLAYIVQQIKNREPNIPMGAIGFSLGGNVLLKWLGETAKNNPLKAAVAVSVPYELNKVSCRINHGFSRIYQWHFLRCLKKKMRAKGLLSFPSLTLSLPSFSLSFPQKRVDSRFCGNDREKDGNDKERSENHRERSENDKDNLDTLRTLRDFDDQITAPLHGFKNAEDYYTKSSSRPYLKFIEIPTLLLHAKDDPFMTEDVLPLQSELSSFVRLELSDKGGHVGFIEGIFPGNAEYWLEKRIPKFFTRKLQ